MYVLMRWENFCCGCFNCNLEAVDAVGFRCPDFGGVKLLLKFSLTILLEAAKNARMWEMQWRSVLRDGQSLLPSRTKVCFFVHLTNVSVVYGEEYKAMWILLQAPLFLVVLCFDNCTVGWEAFLVFIVVWAVLVQNSSQLSPLLRMKLGLVCDSVLKGHGCVQRG